MFTRPPAAAFETTVSIDGMDFTRTDIPNGVDDSGLLVAKTLLTRGQAAHAAQRLQALRKSHRPITHGQIAMHAKSGDADVTAWGHAGNATERFRYPARLTRQILSWGIDKDSTVRAGFAGELFPSALLTVQPGFENHPAAVSWITSVALAAAKTEADVRYLVRLMREDEYTAFLKYVYGDMPEEDIKAMSILYREGITSPVSVVGSEANTRTRKEITDAFGHMCNWLDSHDLTKIDLEGSGLQYTLRALRGASWLSGRSGFGININDTDSLYCNPISDDDGRSSVRLVAVPKM